MNHRITRQEWCGRVELAAAELKQFANLKRGEFMYIERNDWWFYAEAGR